MSIVDEIRRRLEALKPKAKPEPYEVWLAWWPAKYKLGGEPQKHYFLVMAVMEDGAAYRCLMINTQRDHAPHVHELTEEQLRAAGVHHGVFRRSGPHRVPADRFEQRMGCLQAQEAIEIETKICRPPSGASG